jgi:hypothetical protein
MSGSSSSSPPRAAEVSSSRRPQAAARDKNVGSSSRQAARPAREDQRSVCPCVAPSGTGASEPQRTTPRQADPDPLRRLEERPASTRQLYDGSDRPDSDSLQRRRSRAKSTDCIDAERAAGGGVWCRPTAYAIVTYPGWRSPGCSCFPHPGRGPRTNSSCRRGQRVSPRADGGASSRRRGGGPKWSSPRAVGPEARNPRVGLEACSPRAGLVGPAGKETPGALQDVSSRARILHRRFPTCFSY